MLIIEHGGISMSDNFGNGYFLFYNKILDDYYIETNLTNNDYVLMVTSPVYHYIGFFKSLVLVANTLDALKEKAEIEIGQEMQNVHEVFSDLE